MNTINVSSVTYSGYDEHNLFKDVCDPNCPLADH